MRSVLMLLCTCMLFPLYLVAEGKPEMLWERANQEYATGNYEAAVSLYEQLTAQNPAQAEIYYNLGNAYYKLNKMGPAILNYERALWLEPGMKLAKENKSLAESRIPNRILPAEEIFFIRWWQFLTQPQKSGFWSTLACILFLSVLVLFFLRARKTERPFYLQARTLITGFILTGICLLFAGISAYKAQNNPKAVIMHDETTMTLEGSAQKQKIIIPEGTIVTIKDILSSEAYVVLPDGRSGFIPVSSYEVI